MTENRGLQHKTETPVKSVWSGSAYATDSLKEKMLRSHRKMCEELDFAESDFYEDNIYDEPDYWQLSAHTGRNRKH